MTGALLAVEDLRVTFVLGDRRVHAVNGVSFELAPGEVLGLVGESGSGKSAVLRALIGLLPGATAHVEGSVRYDGHELVGARDRALRAIRGADISMVFQDPMTFLNPVLTIGEQIGETLQRHTELGRRGRRARVIELLELVGISAPAQRLRQYPHHLSGGMRQRVVIAIALACGPRVLLADEPTTALDVSVQGQILRLLADLRAQLGMSMILVSHDLGVIAQSCDRVAVMYGGQLVEVAPVAEIVTRPRHPYTVGLLRSLPGRAPEERYLASIPGAPPSLAQAPSTCSFAPRCELAAEGCKTWPTTLLDAGAGRVARCRRHEEVPHV
jgi:peptide/nickel transport system ATP-binding protein/oligopeptide transport system ATP-binding protein